MVAGFSLSSNYCAINVGQLKNVVAPIYKRMIEAGYTNSYPWTETTEDDRDFSMANLGQLKNVFSFDLSVDSDGDGLPDMWEQNWFQDLDETYAGDADGDGFTNGEEHAGGSDPSNELSIPVGAVYVDVANGNDSNDGSWNTPVKSISTGTTVAVSGGLEYVFIHPGTYTGSENRGMDLSGENLTIRGIGTRHGAVIDCDWYGGGVFSTYGGGGDVCIENIVIGNHHADVTGLSPITANGGIMHLVDCAVEACSSGYDAAAVQVEWGTVTMQRCTIGPGNYHPSSGGIVGCASGGQLTMESCLVAGNLGAVGAVDVEGVATLQGCTIASNASPAVHVNMERGYCNVYNSILWNEGQFQVAGSIYGCWLSYCCVQDAASYYGTELIDKDPDLDATYHLNLFSPCIDMGDYDGGAELDIDGEPRPTVNWIDIGADEMSDTDRDGMLDAWEQIVVDSNMAANISLVFPTRDADADGIDNFREYYGGPECNPAEQSPLDTDGDGLSDDYERYYGTDICTQYSNDTFSADAQTWVTALEHSEVIALNIWPNNDKDYDRDGLSNFREICYGTDIHCTDSDGDGVRDGAEADGIGSPSGMPSNPADPLDYGSGDGCTVMELKIGNWFDDNYRLLQPGRFILHVEGGGVEIMHQSSRSLFDAAVGGYALRKGTEYEVLVTCEYPPLEPEWWYQYLAQVNGWPGLDTWGVRWIDGVLIDPGDTLGVRMGYSFEIPDNTPGDVSTRAVDLDVDADYDDQISLGDPDDPIELSAGGMVGFDGDREQVIIRRFVSYPWSGELVLTKNSDKARVFREKTGSDEIIFEGPNANNRFPGYPQDLSLWVQGEEVSLSPRDVELTLSAELEQGQDPSPDCISLTVTDIDLKCIEFTSDHGVLRDNDSDWDSTGEVYPVPEWMPSRGFHPNAPISHTKDSKIGATVTLRVQPAGLAFELIGDAPSDCLDFTKSEVSTGSDQQLTVTAQSKLPNRVCALVDNGIDWTVNGVECNPGSSGPHTVFVTWGTPYQEIETHKRMEWCCDIDEGFNSLAKLALVIRNKTKDGLWLEFGQCNRYPIWVRLIKTSEYKADCYASARLAQAALRLLGVPDVDVDQAYPTGGNPEGDRDAHGVEGIDTPSHGMCWLRYVTEHPPNTEAEAGGYLNRFQGCFRVKMGSEWNYYTVWPALGPIGGDNPLLGVLHSVRNAHPEFGQWWGYKPDDVRYANTDDFPEKIPLPPLQ